MLWVVSQRNLWGDYGDVLINGYADRDEQGRLLLHRAGPFVPPVSFPLVTRRFSRAVVVSEVFRGEL